MIQRFLLSVGVLAIVVFAGGQSAAAASLRETDSAAKSKYDTARSETVQAMNVYQSARADYLSARAKYQQTKSNADLKTTLTEAKDYLLKADRAMTAYLGQLKAKVEMTDGMSDADQSASLAELNADIAWLKSQESTIQSADSRDALVAAATPVKNRWQTIRVSAKRITGRVIAAGTNAVITKLEEAEQKADDRIAQAKGEGYDTTDVEALQTTLESQLALARTSYKEATVKFNAITNLESADTLLREGKNSINQANTHVRSAHATLKNLIAEMKKLQKAEVTGSGLITFQGNGSAVLIGNGRVSGTTGVSTDQTAATLRVEDRAGDANVTTDGKGTSEKVDNKITVYTGLGQATVTGTDVTVTITGPGLDVSASGTGTVKLTGKGSYKVGKDGTSKTLDGKVELQIVGPAVAE
ncbi:MAG: hypothetical protein HYV34_02530 [Candidatus Kerfeldbacteria bacterium]|nr:hypothetical protein [Candidatus Kerfeldbacteria bacterium]